MTTLSTAILLMAANPGQTPNRPQFTEMAGYLIVPHDRVSSEYNAGFSMYVSAWPLLKNYPGQEFQSGLFGTWMFPQFNGTKPKDHYTDIEGGLGWWRDTRFATETPKFIMGGVALNFSEWANGPGAGKGRDWNNPTGLYAVAQLSPWVLWPPDGLNLKQGTKGELFGYGYLPLPLTEPKSSTAGKAVRTGNQCWTLFVNSANFKGPIAFFTPYFWSKASVSDPKKEGQFLDSMPSEPNKAIQMETQHIPAMVAKDSGGVWYAKIAPTRFPGQIDQATPLIHKVSAYAPESLWKRVVSAFEKGTPLGKGIDARSAAVHTFREKGYSTWKIYLPGENRNNAPDVEQAAYATPVPINESTYGIAQPKTNLGSVEPGLFTLPEFYRLDTTDKGRRRWVVVNADAVPAETGLLTTQFPKPKRTTEPYVTPDQPDSSWKKPGPVAGPFRKVLGDGSEVTYYWYKFCDQPALLNADLSDAERQVIQRKVEILHRSWKKDGEYLPKNDIGKLASIDPALLVTPPRGMEIGYVPIVTRQGWPAKN